MLVLDDRGVVMQANVAARAILGRGDGIRETFAGQIELAANPTRVVRGDADASWQRVPRSGGRTAYVVIVTPMSPHPRPPWSGGSVLVVIRDPESATILPAFRLEALFGLTPSEARLTARLARGESLKHIATAHNIAIGTARNQLKQALAKTGTNSQASLTSLVLATIGLLDL